MAENRTAATIAETDVAAILQAIDTIKSRLPFLIDLSPEERQALPKMGDKSQAFVRKALDLVQQDISFMPRSFEVEPMEQDVALFDSLQTVALALNRLTESVNDTLVVAGNEAYTAALVVYKSAKDNGRGGGLDGYLDEMGKRFARKTREPKPIEN
ncbi:MAG: hypothetical protein U0559_03200 [Anaerolineae bacterium]